MDAFSFFTYLIAVYLCCESGQTHRKLDRIEKKLDALAAKEGK